MTVKIVELLDVLEGKANCSDVMDDIIDTRLSALRASLVSALATRGSHPLAEEVLESWEQLPPVNRARLLVSSEFAELVVMRLGGQATEMNEHLDPLTDDSWFVHVADCIMRESLFCDEHLAIAAKWDGERVWSPLGDRSICEIEGTRIVDDGRRIGDVIALDFDSPMAKRTELRSGVLSQARLDMSEDEKQVIQDRLQEALSIIDELTPAYGALIRNFTRRIVLRKSTDENPVVLANYGSEHVPRQPGSIRILNAHQKALTIAGCMETLLHESTHNFLAAWEMGHHRFFDESNQYRPLSPWSGNNIPNSSLAHAIFIYYACHNLFSRYLAQPSNISPADLVHARHRRNVFGGGFMIDQPLSEQFVVTKAPAREVADIMDHMQRTIKRYHGRTVTTGVAA